MRLTILGDSFYAWVAAAQMAALGHQVTLCPDEHALITEPDTELAREAGLVAALHEQVKAGRLRFGRGVDLSLRASGRVALAELTPDQVWLAHDSPVVSDLQLSLSALQSFRTAGHCPAVCVLTPYPVGTLASLQSLMGDTVLYSLSLFVRSGSALSDFLSPSLLLIGCDKPAYEAALREQFRPILRRAREVMMVPLTAAELIKSSINGLLATRMSFMNEVAALCEPLGVDVDIVRQGMAADPRVGSSYLEPGCGFGGPSFSGELLDFSRTLKNTLDLGQLGMVEQALRINERQREVLFRKLWRCFDGQLQGRRIAIWGAAYKPDSAIVKDSAVHPLLKALWAQGAETVVYDPLAGTALQEAYPDQLALTLAESALAAADAADALVLVTAHDEFQNPDFAELKIRLRRPLLLDGRNVYEPDAMLDLGFEYVGIGRGQVV